jgi:hypothetical protein
MLIGCLNLLFILRQTPKKEHFPALSLGILASTPACLPRKLLFKHLFYPVFSKLFVTA